MVHNPYLAGKVCILTVLHVKWHKGNLRGLEPDEVNLSVSKKCTEK